MSGYPQARAGPYLTPRRRNIRSYTLAIGITTQPMENHFHIIVDIVIIAEHTFSLLTDLQD